MNKVVLFVRSKNIPSKHVILAISSNPLENEDLQNTNASMNKRYTFEVSRQVLKSIDTRRLTPCCSLLFVHNSMLLIGVNMN